MKHFTWLIAAIAAGCGFGDNNAARGVTHHACGDGVVDAGEACDDGNTADGDGCSRTCTIETSQPRCGNGTRENGEACDDGNTTDGDGCSHDCQIEHPVEPVCELIPQSGCDGATPACDLDGCRAVTSQGTSNNHCAVDTACKAGYTCVGGNGSDEAAWCARFCEADGDCLGTGSRCVDDLSDASGQPLDVVTCSNACDPYAQTGCPTQMGCLAIYATGGAFTDCFYQGAVAEGGACQSAHDCEDGLACVTHGNSAGVCEPYCIVGNDSTCDDLDTICVGLLHPLDIGAVEYGVCE